MHTYIILEIKLINYYKNRKKYISHKNFICKLFFQILILNLNVLIITKNIKINIL